MTCICFRLPLPIKCWNIWSHKIWLIDFFLLCGQVADWPAYAGSWSGSISANTQSVKRTSFIPIWIERWPLAAYLSLHALRRTLSFAFSCLPTTRLKRKNGRTKCAALDPSWHSIKMERTWTGLLRPTHADQSRLIHIVYCCCHNSYMTVT